MNGMPELTRSTTSYIYDEDGTVFQTFEKMVYNENHLPPDDFLDFMNVESRTVLNKIEKEEKIMTPQLDPYKSLEKKTDEPQKKKIDEPLKNKHFLKIPDI